MMFHLLLRRRMHGGPGCSVMNEMYVALPLLQITILRYFFRIGAVIGRQNCLPKKVFFIKEPHLHLQIEPLAEAVSSFEHFGLKSAEQMKSETKKGEKIING